MTIKTRHLQIRQLNPYILQTDNAGRPILFDLLSPTSLHRYSISISAFRSDKAVCGYQCHCRDKSNHAADCWGNSKTVCKHSLAAFIARLAWQGLKVALCETWASAKRLLNLYAKRGGKVVEIKGNGQSKFGVVYEVTK